MSIVDDRDRVQNSILNDLQLIKRITKTRKGGYRFMYMFYNTIKIIDIIYVEILQTTIITERHYESGIDLMICLISLLFVFFAIRFRPSLICFVRY